MSRSMFFVTAESAGAYKPRPEPYQRAVAELGLPARRVLFVAGSCYDIPGAMAAGMPVWWHNRVGMPRGDNYFGAIVLRPGRCVRR